jgi:hypothetical protein
MTPYEYLDVSQSNLSNAIAIVSLSIAVLSGYVVVAYMVGVKLTRAQVMVLNFNYTLWSFYLLASGGVALANGLTRIRKATEMLGETVALVPYSVYFYYCIGLTLIFTSLWFMWSVRRPKTE